MMHWLLRSFGLLYVVRQVLPEIYGIKRKKFCKRANTYLPNNVNGSEAKSIFEFPDSFTNIKLKTLKKKCSVCMVINV